MSYESLKHYLVLEGLGESGYTGRRYWNHPGKQMMLQRVNRVTGILAEYFQGNKLPGRALIIVGEEQEFGIRY